MFDVRKVQIAKKADLTLSTRDEQCGGEEEVEISREEEEEEEVEVGCWVNGTDRLEGRRGEDKQEAGWWRCGGFQGGEDEYHEFSV